MRVTAFVVPEPQARVQEGQRRKPETQDDPRSHAQPIRHARLFARAAACGSRELEHRELVAES
jgi:hypothetical protein